MGGSYKSITVAIADSLHDVSRSQGNNRADAAGRCSPLHKCIIYCLANLCCIGIAHEQAAQRKRILLFWGGQAGAQTHNAMSLVGYKTADSLYPLRFFSMQRKMRSKPVQNSGNAIAPLYPIE